MGFIVINEEKRFEEKLYSTRGTAVIADIRLMK